MIFQDKAVCDEDGDREDKERKDFEANQSVKYLSVPPQERTFRLPENVPNLLIEHK